MERPPSSQSRTAWDESPVPNPGGMDNPAFNGGELQPAYSATGPPPSSGGALARRSSTDTDSMMKDNEEKAPGFCTRLGHGIRGLWATRETEDTKEDRELHIKTTLRELLIYAVFLILLCIITFAMTNSNMYYFTKAMSELFLDSTFEPTKNTFRGLATRQDWFRFSTQTLMAGLYWEKWYTNANVSDDELGYIYYENKLLGVPRVRLLRVSNSSCDVHDHFRGMIGKCYPPYKSDYESKESYGLQLPTAWQYQSQSSLDGASHSGLIATYSGAGYVQDLNTTMAPSVDKLNALATHVWLDRPARAVFVDFTVYNANINLFCVVRLLTEFPATGGALTTWTFRTVKLIRYVDSMDYFVMACEILLCLFIFYYTIEEILEIKRHGWKYFTIFWNILDVLVLVITAVVLCFNVYRTVEVDKKLDDLLAKPESFPDFDFLSYWQTCFNSAIAVTVFMAWIKVFKYISFNKTMTQLSSTLGRCAKDLAAFAVMFFIVFLAFAQLGYLIFGPHLRDFNSFGDCIFTLFRIILGDFDFRAMESAQRILGPIYFFLYVFFVFFVLLNMFLAIINDTYSDVKAELSQQKSEFEMADYFKQGYDRMLSRLNIKRDKILDIQDALRKADANRDSQLDFDEWRQELKARGYAEAEIEAVFAKYDADGDRILDKKEQEAMHADLEGQKEKLNAEMDKYDGDHRPSTASSILPGDLSGKPRGPVDPNDMVPLDEFDALTTRVDRMEESLGCIVAKIDAVLKGLEGMEKEKLRRRQMAAKADGSLPPVSESDPPSPPPGMDL